MLKCVDSVVIVCDVSTETLSPPQSAPHQDPRTNHQHCAKISPERGKMWAKNKYMNMIVGKVFLSNQFHLPKVWWWDGTDIWYFTTFKSTMDWLPSWQKINNSISYPWKLFAKLAISCRPACFSPESFLFLVSSVVCIE